MINLIIKIFIKDYEKTENVTVRRRYGILAGVLGIICNALLFAAKLTAGVITGSLAVISDAFNNFSDMGVSLVSAIGAKMSGRRPDKEHPFGHGRIEYISSLIISFIIMFFALELMKNSVMGFISPEKSAFSVTALVILGISVAVKLWMYYYNRYMGKKISSTVLRAASADSLGDVWATLAVAVSMVAGLYTDLPVDAACGFAVSLLIMKSGFSIAKETISILLGRTPDAELTESISRLVLSRDEITGIHELVIHDYGPGKIFASVHAEVSETANLVDIHSVLDETENLAFEQLGVSLVIHADPTNEDCEAE